MASNVELAVLTACAEFQQIMSRITEDMDMEDSTRVKIRTILHLGCYPLASFEPENWPDVKKFILDSMSERMDSLMEFAKTNSDVMSH
jgi:hypothetical protein